MLKSFKDLLDDHEQNCFLVAINTMNPDVPTRESLDANKRQSRQILESFVATNNR